MLDATRYDQRWKTYNEKSYQSFFDRLSLANDATLLDVGCGTGNLELKLSRRWPALTISAIDAYEEMVELARQKCSALPKVRVSQADVHALPFEDKHFDHVVSASTFHYFRDPEKALKEIRRVLKPLGKFWLLDWCHDFMSMRCLDYLLWLRKKDYHRCYHENELAGLLKRSGFWMLKQERFKISPLWGLMFFEAEKA